MKEKAKEVLQTIKNFWNNRTKKQRITLISSISLIVFFILAFIFYSLPRDFVPLYNNLSLNEVGQIKEELESRGVPYELKDGGTTITVPKDQADTLLVELAAENIPESGHIDYSFFGENASWGITDHEFSMIKLDAMNNELAKLIKTIEGIDDAKVMITLPEESIFVSDTEQTASASIIIHTQRGFRFEENQIESLYHLVSKAVPNLPKENIVIRNQYLEYFDDYVNSGNGNQQQYTYQQTIKNDIERDLQKRLQQMLGVMVGMDRVFVSVTADVDFTQENRIEELVEPVDLENMEGIPVSIETIHETYSGDAGVDGVPGTGGDEPPEYNELDRSGDGEYELVKETINNEFNHIRKEISESPFKIRDIGIQVAVDNVIEQDGDQIQYLSQPEQFSVEESIHSILQSVIRSSIDGDYGEQDVDEKISIVFQEFSGIDRTPSQTPTSAIPTWVYWTIGSLVIILIIAIVLLIRSRRREYEDVVMEEVSEQAVEVPGYEEIPETETESRQRQIEQMAKEEPEDFAKLLRSWLAED